MTEDESWDLLTKLAHISNDPKSTLKQAQELVEPIFDQLEKSHVEALIDIAFINEESVNKNKIFLERLIESGRKMELNFGTRIRIGLIIQLLNP